MSSVSAISSLAGVQSALGTASQSDPIVQALETLSTAVQSGDAMGANQALTTLQNLIKSSNPIFALISLNTQVQSDFTSMSQAFASGDSTAINNAFAALKKDLTAPVTSELSANSEASLAYVVSLISDVPESDSSSSSTAVQVESNLLTDLTAREAAKIAAQVNADALIDFETRGTMFWSLLLFVAVILLLLWFVF